MTKHNLIFGKNMTKQILEEVPHLSKEEYSLFLVTTDATAFMIEQYLQITTGNKFAGTLVDRLVEEREESLITKGK